MSHLSLVCGTVSFAMALIHSFVGTLFGGRLPHRMAWVLHPECAMGGWAIIWLMILMATEPMAVLKTVVAGIHYEPLYVVTILVVCSSPALIQFLHWILTVSLRINRYPMVAIYTSTIFMGSLVGSLISEPAAMSLVCSIVGDVFFKHNVSAAFKYVTLGLVFVCVSIGGALTTLSAPPVVLVASAWGWSSAFTARHFGPPILLTLILSIVTVTIWFWAEINRATLHASRVRKPKWMSIVVTGILLVTAIIGRHSVSLLLMSIGASVAMRWKQSKEQSIASLTSAAWIGFFLIGVVVLSRAQGWWAGPLISNASPPVLFGTAVFLSGIVDNATVTTIGTQVAGMSTVNQYLLVAGAICGGGLTIIANAPNPLAGHLLKSSFGPNGIHPVKLALGAAVPTVMAAILFWSFR